MNDETMRNELSSIQMQMNQTTNEVSGSLSILSIIDYLNCEKNRNDTNEKKAEEIKKENTSWRHRVFFSNCKSANRIRKSNLEFILYLLSYMIILTRPDLVLFVLLFKEFLLYAYAYICH
jgi:hypothetical protein